jgi:hypothetical protein
MVSMVVTRDHAMNELDAKLLPCRLVDFATIFSYMWYRDFPLHPTFREQAQRADWTTHIGISVRSTADLMGLFTHFESGGRTDAILRTNQGNPIAALEWEWNAIHQGDSAVNEFEKLRARCGSSEFRGLEFACLIGYARDDRVSRRRKLREFDRVVDYRQLSLDVRVDYQLRWAPDSDYCETDFPPLLIIIIHYCEVRTERVFHWMTIDAIKDGNFTRLRTQRAYPWDVNDSRWSGQVNEKR